MDMLDKQIRDYFTREASIRTKTDRLEHTPSVDDFYAFVTDKLEGEALENFLDYLKKNPEAQKITAQARTLILDEEGSEKEKLPAGLVRFAKDLKSKNNDIRCPHCLKPITPFKKPLKTQKLYNLMWLTFSAAGFLGSFIFRRYFFQCLAVALIFGIKWVMDQRSTKTQVLIYKALKEEGDCVHSRRLHSTQSHV